MIYTAHWDHLGIGQPDANGDRIYNGAIDNATGTAHVIEQARAFATGPRPQRSVVFLAVTAEEKGLLGCEYYAANPLYPLAKTAGVINTDVMGVLGPARDFSISRQPKFGLLDMLVDEGKKRAATTRPIRAPEAGGFFRSDHFPFAKAGVPAISFSRRRPGQRRRRARQALAADYTAKRYHQPDDEYRPTGTSPAWPRTPSCCTPSASGSPIQPTGRTGAGQRIPRGPRSSAPSGGRPAPPRHPPSRRARMSATSKSCAPQHTILASQILPSHINSPFTTPPTNPHIHTTPEPPRAIPRSPWHVRSFTCARDAGLKRQRRLEGRR